MRFHPGCASSSSLIEQSSKAAQIPQEAVQRKTGAGCPNPWSMCCQIVPPGVFYFFSLIFCRQMVPVPLHGDPESKRCSKRIFSLHFQFWCLLLLQKVVGLFHCKAAHCRSKVCPLDSKLATATWARSALVNLPRCKIPSPPFFFDLAARVQFRLLLYSALDGEVYTIVVFSPVLV